MDRYDYKVEIELDGKRGAYLKVTKFPKKDNSVTQRSRPIPVGFGTSQSEYVIAFMGNPEKKARRRAQEIINKWKAKDYAEQKKIVYTV